MAWTTTRFCAARIFLGSLCYFAFSSIREKSPWSSPESSIPDTRGVNTTSSTTNTTTTHSHILTKGQNPCGLYFAPSTIPEAGFGLFAGRHYEKGKVVTPGDLVVPFVDLTWHYGYERFADDLWEEYRWSANTFPGMDREGQDVSGASFGIGAMPNSFYGLNNVVVGKSNMDFAGLHRSRDAGAGAFTPYVSRTGFAKMDIAAGMELFISYGSNYFSVRQDDYGLLPTMKDYEQGDELVSRFVNLRDGLDIQHQHSKGDDDPLLRMESSSSSSSSPLPQLHPPLTTSIQSSVLHLVHSLAHVWQSRPLSTLPQDPEHIGYVSQHGTSKLHYNRSIRSLDWLEENGVCMDNIRPGLSTIEQAGHGGFATRHFQEGDVVAAMPLIHIPDRNLYRMYGESILDNSNDDHDDDGMEVLRNVSAPVHWQLMLNYCFGHLHSSLLLCPYGVMTSTINHSKEHTNVKIRWSRKASRHYEWLEQPVRQWGRTRHAGLAFELIATRDINEDEELLLDYGNEWTVAWENHVVNWEPLSGSESYATADELNQRLDVPIRTVAEGSYDPKDKLLYCLQSRRKTVDDEKDKETELRPCQAIHRYQNSAGEDRYTVEVSTDKKGPVQELVPEVLHDFPRQAFLFRDSLYSRDFHLRTTFRHDLRIPDEIMPKAWLDRLEYQKG